MVWGLLVFGGLAGFAFGGVWWRGCLCLGGLVGAACACFWGVGVVVVLGRLVGFCLVVWVGCGWFMVHGTNKENAVLDSVML